MLLLLRNITTVVDVMLMFYMTTCRIYYNQYIHCTWSISYYKIKKDASKGNLGQASCVVYSNSTSTLQIRFYKLCIITNSVVSFDLIINRIRIELYFII